MGRMGRAVREISFNWPFLSWADSPSPRADPTRLGPARRGGLAQTLLWGVEKDE